MKKRLMKSRTDRKLAGVCGGIAEYLEVDPTVIRLVWVIVSLIGGSGLLAYIAAAILMPEE
ncbi:MAG: PspC domain-containing protein [Oscillospiraceae bacterium]|nr:PspC domain-containing protein [Oscillospiraceae bacterium]